MSIKNPDGATNFRHEGDRSEGRNADQFIVKLTRTSRTGFEKQEKLAGRRVNYRNGSSKKVVTGSRGP
jgi:hypothetical protein